MGTKGRRANKRRPRTTLNFETLQPRALLATFATTDGAWSDPSIWSNGVPDASQRAIINQGVTVELDDRESVAQELVIQGNLVVTEDANTPDKTLSARWVHVNSFGVFSVGSENDRYDEGTFTLNLTGTDPESDHVIQGVAMPVMNNDGFLMTASEGRIQFFGEEKLSFTKLAETTIVGRNTITVENIIERNFSAGASNADGFVTTAADDGELNWEVGDQIVIASSSYDYTEEEVRRIVGVVNNGTTTTLTLDSALEYRHYGQIEVYGEASNAAPGTTPASQTYEIDLRAEVALLSRNVKIQGDPEQDQDTDIEFGDRGNVQYEDRVGAAGLTQAELNNAPDLQVANGVGGHLMFMPSSGQITVDGVQLEGLGQSSQKGRYPIHWHLGNDRSGDVFRNSSVNNSNNRGVAIHGTSNLEIEGVVLHDIHGHGFFFEDAVETGNKLVANLALGIHTVGGNDSDAANPGGKDPFVVDTHDSVLETGSRFSSSAAYWITNPSNTFIGNIAAGAGDSREADYAESTNGISAGTGFWFALPRTVLGASANNSLYDNVIPIFAELGQFDYNTSHTTAVGLNFDRGSDIEDGNFEGELRTNHGANEYQPRSDVNDPNSKTVHTIKNFTNYKASDAAFYHRGEANTILLDGLKVADSYNGPWAVSENQYDNSLFVGHSQGNADFDAQVGGPRLYDGAGLYTNTHFAGFADDDAFAFQVEGSSFGPTMYHAFRGTSFEQDGTYGHIAHAVSDFQVPNTDAGHDLSQPARWIKGVIDLDGTLTGGVGGGAGYSIVPEVDFLVDADDVKPAGWNAYLTNDIYARVRIQNFDDGVPLFPSQLFPNETNPEPLIRFTAASGQSIDVVAGQDINGQFYWTQVAAKADSDGDGFVADDFTIEFGRNGLPEGGFALNMNNQDGGRPSLNQAIQDRVDQGRIVLKFIGAANYTLEINGQAVTEVASETALRSATDEVVYYTDNAGNLYINTPIVDNQPDIDFLPGDTLQTPFAVNTVDYGTVIEAEHFDVGPDGIAYHDSDTTNTLGSFRSTGVDATSTVVGNIADGEWLEYTANIVDSGYNIGVNVSATADGGQIRVLAANSNSAGFLRELGTIDVTDTLGQFSTMWLDEPVDLQFAAGADSVIRLEFVGGGFEVDSIEFAEPTQTAYLGQKRIITADFTTTTIELEEFDDGGQGIAYRDTTAGNEASNSFRTDEDVDVIEGRLQGEVREGEWLEYTTNIQAGVYDITLRKEWGSGNEGVRLFIGQSNADREFTFLGEYDFVDGSGPELIELSDVDLTPWAGSDRVIRIEIVGQFMGLDYLEFTSKSSDQSAPNAEVVVPTIGPTSSNAGVVTIDFDEDVFGFDIGDLTLTRDATEIDISGLVLTQISPNQYTIDLSNVTTEDGTYELSLNHAGSGISDSAGNAFATDALDQFMIDTGGDVTFLPGDVNQDGVVNFLDISPFISLLSNEGFLEEADTNGDGVVNFLDISSFIAALTNQ